MKHCSISNSVPPRWIRRVKQGLHFFLHQIPHQTGVGFLEWDRQNTANLFDCAWLTVLKKAEE
jgi:hypothetical protein